LQYASSFTPTISDNGPVVNQEDHDDEDHDEDDFDCDPSFEDCTDSDGDGSPDWDDDCINDPGPESNYGCPVGQEPDDSDGDGVPDYDDDCPNDPGPYENYGCPNGDDGGHTEDVDSDGDGWYDFEDDCPNEWGQDYGCPDDTPPDDYGGYSSWDAYCKGEFGSEYYYDDFDDTCYEDFVDTDGDGWYDDEDDCPNEWGQDYGCPFVDAYCKGEFGSEYYYDDLTDECGADFDDDGIQDHLDNCPGDWGPDWNNGCPEDVDVDTDGDGWYDDEDDCPNEWGQDYGCPFVEDFGGYNSWDAYCKGEFGSTYYYDDVDDGCFEGDLDSDGDGVIDRFDACLFEYGLSEFNGCPEDVEGADIDGDGFNDTEDWCPNEWGPSWGQGCPEEVDYDGDGVPDNDDTCPDDWGTSDYYGCISWDAFCKGEYGQEYYYEYLQDECLVYEYENIRPEVTGPKSVTTDENTPVRFTITAYDPDGPQAQVSFNPRDHPDHGTLAFVPGGQSGNQHDYIYTPDPNFSGMDSFSIMVWDGTVNSEIVTIPITVGSGEAQSNDSDGDGVPDWDDICPGTQN